jgi:hypothetical protein
MLLMPLQDNPNAEIKDFTADDSFRLTMTMISNLHYQYLSVIEDAEQTSKGTKFTWKTNEPEVVREHVLFVTIDRLAAYMGVTPVTGDIISLVLVSVCSLIIARARLFTHMSDFENPFVWQSIFSICADIEEYLFFTPFTTHKPMLQLPKMHTAIGVHTSKAGKILECDFKIVQRTIDVLKTLRFNQEPASLTYSMSKGEKEIMMRGCTTYMFFKDILAAMNKYNSATSLYTRDEALTGISALVLPRHKKAKKLGLSIQEGTKNWKTDISWETIS